VEIRNVSKAFTIRHNRSQSLKTNFIGFFHKRFRETKEILWALKDISLTVNSGETLGLIGRNGSGKSTLLRVIAGIYAPTAGEIHWSIRAKIGAMIELGVGFHPELTGKENVFLGASIHGLTRREIDEIYPLVVQFSELDGFMDVPFKNYSSGMQARLGFGLAVNLNPDVLLVDEIFAVGDEAFKGKCTRRMEQLRADNKTIVFVSHDAKAVKEFCDQAVLIDRGALVFAGKPEETFKEYHAIVR
jgi:ABC-type polysaccharide/polyol phosphate transport system ATPase subunit